MSQKVFTQSFTNSIPDFTQSLRYMDHLQTSFNHQNFASFQSHHLQYDINSQYSMASAKHLDDEFKHFNNANTMNFYDTQPGSVELNSPATTTFTRCDSNKDDDQDSHKTKSPAYRDIDQHSPEGSLKREHEESDSTSGSMLNEKSKKILKRRSQRDPDASKNSNRKSQNKGKRSSWSSVEDNHLMELMNTYGKKWSKIAAMMEGRTGKQVRDRYVNVLMPDINRTGWEDSEDQLILATYQQIGPKWSKIAESLQGRTEGQVKNRFYSFLKKKFTKEEEEEKNNSKLNGNCENTFLDLSPATTVESPCWKPVAAVQQQQQTNMLQQCLQRVEEISQTNNLEQNNKIQGMIQYPFIAAQPSYLNFHPHQNEYFAGDFYCAPQTTNSVPVADPTDVISFEELNYGQPPINYWTDLENKMLME